MKRFLLTAALTAALFAAAQEDEGLSFSVRIDPARIEFLTMTYTPENIVTNISYEWVETFAVYTNYFFGLRDDEVVTNAVRQQVALEHVVTNAAFWTTPFIYTLPAKKPVLMGGTLDARPQRDAVFNVQLVIPATLMRESTDAAFYQQMEVSASLFGALPVQGALADVMRNAVMLVMQNGGIE
ncbi:MAG: hypothetical protein WC959_05475 [Kiritimatiellales bacterium]